MPGVSYADRFLQKRVPLGSFLPEVLFDLLQSLASGFGQKRHDEDGTGQAHGAVKEEHPVPPDPLDHVGVDLDGDEIEEVPHPRDESGRGTADFRRKHLRRHGERHREEPCGAGEEVEQEEGHREEYERILSGLRDLSLVDGEDVAPEGEHADRHAAPGEHRQGSPAEDLADVADGHGGEQADQSDDDDREVGVHLNPSLLDNVYRVKHNNESPGELLEEEETRDETERLQTVGLDQMLDLLGHLLCDAFLRGTGLGASIFDQDLDLLRHLRNVVFGAEDFAHVDFSFAEAVLPDEPGGRLRHQERHQDHADAREGGGDDGDHAPVALKTHLYHRSVPLFAHLQHEAQEVDYEDADREGDAVPGAKRPLGAWNWRFLPCRWWQGCWTDR
jgi:hypothetical protein